MYFGEGFRVDNPIAIGGIALLIRIFYNHAKNETTAWNMPFPVL